MPILEELPWLPAGSYNKVRKISNARFGKVFLAEKVGIATALSEAPQRFVMKAMSKAKMLEATGELESGMNEIKAALALRTFGLPYTVKCFGAVQDANHVFLLSEYCALGELFTVVRQAGVLRGDAVAREVCVQLLLALASLHGVGASHGDVSLENVLVTENGTLRLIDFGQAILTRPPGAPVGQEARCVDRSRGLPGKSLYRAPEVSRSGAYLASKADIYAAGVVLFVLVAGAYPFGEHYSPSLEEARLGRCSCLVARLEELRMPRGEVSLGLLDLLERLLAPDPDARPEALDALAHPWCRGEGSPTTTPLPKG
jgi:serine/threonine protein kinase